ncbi:MupA/Atu3671 family FMN-dependent luciferase-like monooxygenase [Plantactinospora sp. KBS50]|uniref:MupA/Atu3671 family FMN-dependent luciferase-like monooxygenase n=1 Tax=Plantactinospora sp. KBS50 TaxID=2024580 RepID=UPI000BAB089C|nr:MupA/Atu3671 family FMN-dependent luciferase-like monooxygenase [Plantactinospora sp. KBS50]ASW54604.1 LLM class flavin-dependent oxidoreductase [Plantactinospora sp. KBS50]
MTDSRMNFGLFFFAALGDDAPRTYQMMLAAARRGEELGLDFVSTPERHFHRFGGAFPNPAVTSAALAAVTSRLQIRAGSVVTPLHPALRIVEDFALVDCLSEGRAAISVGSGWNVNDFVLNPAAYADRRDRMLRDVAEIRQVWRDGTWSGTNPVGGEVTLPVFPRPVQDELPIWVTVSRNPETFRQAGELGANVLTHLENQDVDAVAGNIERYREAFARHHPGRCGTVTLMMHTYVADSTRRAHEVALPWLRSYLRTAIDLESRAVGAGGGMSGGRTGRTVMTEERARDRLVEIAVNRYLAGTSLIGSVSDCRPVVDAVRAAGVDEIACLVDFVGDGDAVLAGLPHLAELATAVPAPLPA